MPEYKIFKKIINYLIPERKSVLIEVLYHHRSIFVIKNILFVCFSEIPFPVLYAWYIFNKEK